MARDPGLQPERTALAWTRTAGGMLVNALLCLRAGYLADGAGLVSLALALLAASGLTFAIGRHRRRQLLSAGAPVAVAALAIRLVVAATLLAALTGLCAILQSC